MTSPQPIATLIPEDGRRFLGLVLQKDTEGKPFWETIELLQWINGQLFNCNSGNYTHLGKSLTHWMPEPLVPRSALAHEPMKDEIKPTQTVSLKGYKLCPECGQPILKKGQQRKHPDEYRHARGCPGADEC